MTGSPLIVGGPPMPLVLTPHGEYEARLREIDTAHDNAMAQITAAAEVLTNNAEQWAARVQIERKAAFDKYQAAIKAAN